MLEIPLNPYYLKWIESDESLRKLATRVYLKSGSTSTVRTYLDGVIMLSKFLEMKPSEILKAKLDWEGILNEFIAYLIYERKTARGTALNYFSGVKKWLEINLPKEDWYSIDWRRIDKPSKWKVERDRIPTREDLRLILKAANPAWRAIITLAVSSGLRQGTIINLKIGNIKIYENGKIKPLTEYLKENKPLSSEALGIILVEPEIAKERPEKYLTFCTAEALKHILMYLKIRMKRGEKLSEDTLLFVNRSKRKINPHTFKYNWLDILARVDKNVKHRKWHIYRFHTLRKYFSTWCKLSGVDPWVVEAWMGHKAGIHQVYFLSGIEDLENPVLIARLAEEYRKAVPTLTIFTEEEKIRELEKRLEEEIKARDEIIKMLKEELKQLEAKIAEIERKARNSSYMW
ncbi:MAG: tyrosine-type recombinase/integrase [archaeon GB-1867-005]|nr:tyrosine-type recombinase/integrase [Candidatus Culexmicrobium cathedralense]